MSRPYTFEDDVSILSGYAAKDRRSDIATRLGRTERSICQRFARLQRKARIRARSLTGSANA